MQLLPGKTYDLKVLQLRLLQPVSGGWQRGHAEPVNRTRITCMAVFDCSNLSIASTAGATTARLTLALIYDNPKFLGYSVTIALRSPGYVGSGPRRQPAFSPTTLRLMSAGDEQYRNSSTIGGSEAVATWTPSAISSDPWR